MNPPPRELQFLLGILCVLGLLFSPWWSHPWGVWQWTYLALNLVGAILNLGFWWLKRPGGPLSPS